MTDRNSNSNEEDTERDEWMERMVRGLAVLGGAYAMGHVWIRRD
jgi:hypothetical protein